MKNKTTIAIIAFLILAGAAAIFSARTDTTNTPQAQKKTVSSALVTDDTQYDFGTIDIFGGKVHTQFPVTNTGEEAVTILDGTTSCACTSAELDGIDFNMHKGMSRQVTIEPGETKMLTATYDPLFHGPNGTGKITREVILKTNSNTTPELRAKFKADVVKNEQ